MSWRSHGKDNASLVEALRGNEILRSASVANAMLLVDRGLYCTKDGGRAYVDAPQAIGAAATISAPHMHAYCLELMRDHLKPGARCLDVGSGSGYLTAIMAHMVDGGGVGGRRGKATGIEHIPELVEESRRNARRDPKTAPLLESGALELLVGDGRLGHAVGGPYDCIHVGAAASEVPAALTEQLAEGGRLVVPVGQEGETQNLCVIDRKGDGSLATEEVMRVVYVPLCSKSHQLDKRRWM
ncbi:protein-L-isoaspartate O-methyltransferase [Chloropicon primus]|uniref:protein-L-isoaspartate(D-aspartate) O-methyltransferase n=1 Tax=Chloropicon primus TaxID=1764295 RepID=A0A5B8MPY7_9CHLO|nr:protein-L-isoaspartate O-methyltransferase [Chloropicon primus]UPR01767.1 protein-L-isoaspartate O-methyltransferase [Chloropicon primus]|eukprot:QDZ22546.1 protein-L-isoaspartate O-methyltransferase [Chloropicon primus]